MNASAKWSDLAPRSLSALVLAGAGVLIVWAGGWLFLISAAALCGAMIWETVRMFGAERPLQAGGLAGVALLLSGPLPLSLVFPVLLGAAAVAASQAARDKPLCMALSAWILMAVFALVHLREHAGAVLVFWLVLVVIFSDIAGYFAGRMIGGPRFWPRVSPKKTWSGTIAGWFGAALVGLGFVIASQAGAAVVAVSVLVGIAGQVGDIAQSAAKRRAGVKDSSALLPGHGGVFDRFDALLGATVLVSLLSIFGAMPGFS